MIQADSLILMHGLMYIRVYKCMRGCLSASAAHLRFLLYKSLHCLYSALIMNIYYVRNMYIHHTRHLCPRQTVSIINKSDDKLLYIEYA